jgi:hypothetical protein
MQKTKASPEWTQLELQASLISAQSSVSGCFDDDH